MPKSQIFINYRRDDSQESTVFLSQLLALRYPGQVFFDRDTIQPGRKYLTDIHASLQECGVVIAVIGERWLTLKNPAGESRLHDPQDILRLELKVAIERGISIIPLLVGNSRMPTSKDLPEDIRPLAEFQATRIYFDDVATGLDRLCKAIDNRLAEHPRPQPIPTPLPAQTLVTPPSPPPVSSAPPTTLPSPAQLAARADAHAASPPTHPPRITPPLSTAKSAPLAPSLPAHSAPLPGAGSDSTFFTFLRSHRRAFIAGAAALVLAYIAYSVYSSARTRSHNQHWNYVWDHQNAFVVPGAHDQSWTSAIFAGSAPNYSNGLQWAARDFSKLPNSSPVTSLADAWHAVEAYNRAAYGSYTDWRLPTAMEPDTLCGTSARRALYKNSFSSSNSSYWTSDVPVTAIVNCFTGSIDRVPEERSYRKLSDPSAYPSVRPVRGSLR